MDLGEGWLSVCLSMDSSLAKGLFPGLVWQYVSQGKTESVMGNLWLEFFSQHTRWGIRLSLGSEQEEGVGAGR